jgi:AraC-like DNA-binding protein
MEGVLHAETLLDRDGVSVSDVACRHESGRGEADEHTLGHTLVFVRRGCFARSAEGVDALLDPTVAYGVNPGDEQRYDHPHEDGDDCTAIGFDADLLASVWGGEPELPHVPLPTSPQIDLEQRLLLAAARQGADPHELVERAIVLSARALERIDAARVASGRPATARARQALTDGAREALAAAPERSLADLARLLAVSPHHLSRVFRGTTGHTVARHRMRLRARTALERLAGGEDTLARLAADLGFADQAHLTRVIRAETGHTPSVLRQALAA